MVVVGLCLVFTFQMTRRRLRGQTVRPVSRTIEEIREKPTLWEVQLDDGKVQEQEVDEWSGRWKDITVSPLLPGTWRPSRGVSACHEKGAD